MLVGWGEMWMVPNGLIGVDVEEEKKDTRLLLEIEDEYVECVRRFSELRVAVVVEILFNRQKRASLHPSDLSSGTGVCGQ